MQVMTGANDVVDCDGFEVPGIERQGSFSLYLSRKDMGEDYSS